MPARVGAGTRAPETAAMPGHSPREQKASGNSRTAPRKERRKTDYEKYIGENLFGKIGIFVLILGVGFFVKYAIDNDWLEEGMRTALGFACGAVLLGTAARLRNKYRSFSSLLAGGSFRGLLRNDRRSLPLLFYLLPGMGFRTAGTHDAADDRNCHRLRPARTGHRGAGRRARRAVPYGERRGQSPSCCSAT